jgi:kumamolisin
MESVWNDQAEQGGATGGGISDFFERPAWQATAIASMPLSAQNFRGRGVPDVAGLGDPDTGYIVSVNGEAQVVGGTSAVAPLWAALAARLNQALGVSVGELNQIVYQLPENVFHDITVGNNGSYKACSGWDPCTGLGSPIGTKLLSALQDLKAANKPV